jgi:hypothetical protein
MTVTSHGHIDENLVPAVQSESVIRKWYIFTTELKKGLMWGQVLWHIPMVPASQKVEIGGSQSTADPSQKAQEPT